MVHKQQTIIFISYTIYSDAQFNRFHTFAISSLSVEFHPDEQLETCP